MNKIIAALVILAILALGITFLLSKKSPERSSTNTLNSPQQTQTETDTSSDVSNTEMTVSVTKSGFEPKSVTIKPGERITWINNSGEDATVNSDDHPTHQLFPELNLGIFPKDVSVQTTLSKPGTYTYHDHLHPERTGTIIVK